MKCPVCNAELKIAGRQGVEIDHCLQCRGVWLDRGELDKLIERSRAIAESYDLDEDDYEDRRVQHTDDDDRHYEERRRGGRERHKPQKRRRESFLGEIFDIF